MTPTAQFVSRVHKVWGKPKRVAEAAIIELFRQAENGADVGFDHDDWAEAAINELFRQAKKGEDVGLDYDDQVENALIIGVMAREMKAATPDEFIAAFVAKFSNEDEGELESDEEDEVEEEEEDEWEDDGS